MAHGVVAHLGERIAGSDEVESSSLFGSTFFVNTLTLWTYKGSVFVEYHITKK